ncbi:hypothetical protein XENTR_v10005049 [Xenopus tropicalis]|nr:hypothetical protein XENTR_v10005049 [Xenopus tropicalis]
MSLVSSFAHSGTLMKLVQCRPLFNVESLLPQEEHEVDHILFQYEQTQQARRVLGPKLEALHNNIVARQKELEEAAKINGEEIEEPPVVEVPRLSTRRRLMKAIAKNFHRIWVTDLFKDITF